MRLRRTPVPTITDMPADVQLMQNTFVTLMSMSVLLLLVLVGWWGTNHSYWNLQRIEIKGDLEHNGVASIRANAIPSLKGNFFTLDLLEAQKNFEAIPWIRSAKLRRVWPRILEVELSEHEAVAIWNKDVSANVKNSVNDLSDPDQGLINKYGELFFASPSDIDGGDLPKLVGPRERTAEMWSFYYNLTPILSEFKPDMNQRASDFIVIDELSLSPRGSWSAKVDGVKVVIGRGASDKLLERCRAFVQSVNKAAMAYQSKVLYADLRQADGYALRLAGVNMGAETRGHSSKVGLH